MLPQQNTASKLSVQSLTHSFMGLQLK